MRDGKDYYVRVRVTKKDREDFKRATYLRGTTSSIALHKFITNYIKRVMK